MSDPTSPYSDSTSDASTHTPGQWVVFDGYNPGIDAGDYTIIVFGERDDDYGINGATKGERLANARLIAAAPETAAERDRLVEVLRDAVKAFDNGAVQIKSAEIDVGDPDIPPHPWHEGWISLARAAIANARKPESPEGVGG